MTFAGLWRVDIRRALGADSAGRAIESRLYLAVRFGMSLVPGELTLRQYPPRYGPRYSGKWDWSLGSTLEEVPTVELFNAIHNYGARGGDDWDEVEAMTSAYFDCPIHAGFWGRGVRPVPNDRQRIESVRRHAD